MGIQIMESGTAIPQRKKTPKAWTRRAIADELGRSPETIYKWEFLMHSELLQLPHSCQVWQFIVKQGEGKKKRHPPLDDYQIECLFLLGELRKNTANSVPIAQTVNDNGLMFHELHQLYSPLHPKEES